MLKLESVQEDLSEYLNDLGLKEYADKFPWSNPSNSGNFALKTSHRAVEFYSRLNRSTIEELYSIYKIDHEMFGYDPKYFLELGDDK